MSSLTDLYISDSYTGLLHSGGIALSSTGKSKIYDGSGQESALSLGKLGNGASISGTLSTSNLTVGNIVFPSTPGSVGSVLYQQTATTIGFSSDLPGSILENIIPNGTYTNIKSITVTDQGLVDDITEYDDSDGITVSITTYITPVDLGSIILTGDNVGDSWDTVNLPSQYTDYKAGIFFLRPARQLDLNDNTNCVVYTSPDKSAIYPIHSFIEDSNEPNMVGFQFQAPIINNKLYFTRAVLTGNVDSNPAMEYKLFGLAKQQ